MILAVDIGNTNTHLAFFSAPDKIIVSESISNAALNKESLDKVIKINGGKKSVSIVRSILASSTNPEVEPIINEWCKKVFKIKPLEAGKDFGIPIINRTDAPEKVGKDRLLNALAARHLVKGKNPILVISCGTAITLDIVSSKGEFLGGVIAPGISMLAKALYQNCAQLSWVKLPSKKPDALGRNTQDAIISGVYYGSAGLVRNIICELARELKLNPASLTIVITGGDAQTVKSAIPYKNKIIPDLTLIGLVLAYPVKSLP